MGSKAARKKAGAKPAATVEAGPAKFDRADLMTALHHTLAHASTDETRGNLRCVQVRRLDGVRVRFAATDGHRVIAYVIQSGTPGTGKEADLLIDRDEVKTILAVLKSGKHEEIVLDFDARKLRIGTVTVAIKVPPDGALKFPPIEKVMVKPERTPEQNIFINADYLAQALAACHSTNRDSHAPRVRMNLGKQIDPLRFDVFEHDNRSGRGCTVILMPCRPVDEPKKEKKSA